MGASHLISSFKAESCHVALEDLALSISAYWELRLQVCTAMPVWRFSLNTYDDGEDDDDKEHLLYKVIGRIQSSNHGDHLV